MIRAHRVNATAQDDASLISGWNISPNIDYALAIIPSAASCGVILWDAAGVLVATGAALVGTEQPCILTPQSWQTVGMIDAELGWHLLLTTDGTENQRTIRIGPAVDLPDEIHPVYGDDDMGLARATAAIDEAAHYRDDVAVSCPLGLGAGLGDVVSVPVDGVAVVGQVESITWTATPDGTTEQAVIRRHVAIAPEPYVEPTPITPPTVADDTGATDAATATSGNVLTNDEPGLTVVAVNGLSASVGVAVAGNNGGMFTIASDGAWTFDPNGDFATLSGSETAETSVMYYASDGVSEAMGTLTVTVSRSTQQLWTPAEVTTALWLDAADAGTITLSGAAVSQWRDKSGNGRHATQATGSAQPSFSAAGAGGGPGVYFDTGDSLSGSAWTSGASHSLFCVCVPPSAGDRKYVFTSGEGQSTDSNRLFFAPRNATQDVGIYDGSAWRGTVDAISGMQLLVWVLNGSTSAGTTRRNGAALESISYSPRAILDGVSIGARTAVIQNYFLGWISEIIKIDDALSVEDTQKLEGYLAHKWGLVENLPSNHPYKSAPPTI